MVDDEIGGVALHASATHFNDAPAAAPIMKNVVDDAVLAICENVRNSISLRRAASAADPILVLESQENLELLVECRAVVDTRLERCSS